MCQKLLETALHYETRNWKVQRRDLKKSIEFTENVLKSKVSKVENNFYELRGKVTKVEEDLIYMNNHVKDTECF